MIADAVLFEPAARTLFLADWQRILCQATAAMCDPRLPPWKRMQARRIATEAECEVAALLALPMEGPPP